MKVTTLLGAVAATTAVNAFPFMAGMESLEGRSELEQRGIITDTINGLLGNNKFQGLPFTQMIEQMKSFSNWSPESLGNLANSMNMGFANVTDLMNFEGRGIPEGGKGILSKKLGELSGGDGQGGPIIDAFGLNRGWPEHGPDAGSYHGNGGGPLNDWVWGGPSQEGEHEWAPPDNYWKQRGPCPALNTAANHGFLPRDGIILPHELFIGMWKAVSLSPDMAALLGTLSYLFHGDPLTLTLSIGFQKDRTDVQGRKRGGTGVGDHGILEGDASVTRNDAGLSEIWYGKDRSDWWSLNNTLWETFRQENANGVTLTGLAAGRKRAWQYGRDNNPYFDFNPWRMIVAYAESGFTWQALKGSQLKMTPEMLESFFVHERFPPGWKRRFVPITIAEMIAWGAVVAALNPTVPGWNLGIKSSNSIFGWKLPTWLGGSEQKGGYVFTTDPVSWLGGILPLISNPGQSIAQLGCGPVKVFKALVPTWITGQSASGKRGSGGLGGLFDQVGGLNGFSC